MFSNSRGFLKLFTLSLSLLLPTFYSVNAQDLQLLPMRVVFEGSNQVEVLNVINSGADTSTYSISFIQYRMTENGAMESITAPDSGQQFADKNIRYFPRKVRLAPGEAQAVKVQVYRASQLAPGEYRSHLYFKKEMDEAPFGTITDQADQTESEGISMQIVPVFGITIPVIIRAGAASAQVELSDLSLVRDEKGNSLLNLKLNRTGNKSVYGKLEVQHIAPTGEKTQVGLVKGVAVYTPNTARTFLLSLAQEAVTNYQAGKLLVVYRDMEGNKETVLAQAALQLESGN
ncbi:hypothetical protein ACFSKU_17270 [Pontibacter silvestris]|uniref:Molecular chaperone n=1 Tax=Pontibacter silvestris TaxID=2305183 RepID=A0ABW4X0X2_9BACT|nr:hypothetical protein [Pontibacter silvestris]MCC9135774.1 hypothetical protein [Pontibacter silvestris]